jgi:hypothetical protein
MNKLLKYIFISFIFFFLSCQRHYKVEEVIEYLPFKSPKKYKIIRDTTIGDYWQKYDIIIEKQYYSYLKRMIKKHQSYMDFGTNKDSLDSYFRSSFNQLRVYQFDNNYHFFEVEESRPELENTFLYFEVIISKDSVLNITCRPI